MIPGMKERPNLREFYEARGQNKILRQRWRANFCTVLVSHRRGGPMCPPVVGIPNSPKNGREPYGVSAGRTRRSAPTADGADGRKFSDTFYHFNAPYEMKRGYLTATLESQFLHCASISPSGRTYVSARGRHFEFAEKWEGIVRCFCRADTWVHPYGRWEEVFDVFCHFDALYGERRGCYGNAEESVSAPYWYLTVSGLCSGLGYSAARTGRIRSFGPDR